MAVFTFDLSAEDRATLEAHRIRMGARSHAEALRRLIRGDAAGSVPPSQAIPPGMVLVPREPTPEMLADDAVWANALAEDAAGVWAAMIGVFERAAATNP
jgi:hypothetical protein